MSDAAAGGIVGGMSTPSNKPSTDNLPATDPFAHLLIGDSANVEKLKAEFRERMKESGKRWPKKRAKKRRPPR